MDGKPKKRDRGSRHNAWMKSGTRNFALDHICGKGARDVCAHFMLDELTN